NDSECNESDCAAGNHRHGDPEGSSDKRKRDETDKRVRCVNPGKTRFRPKRAGIVDRRSSCASGSSTKAKSCWSGIFLCVVILVCLVCRFLVCLSTGVSFP